MHEGIPPKLFPVYDLPFKAKMCSEMKRCITKWSISKYFSFSTFPIFFCVCVCTNRNDDFFFATKQFSLLLLLTVKQYIDFPRVLISTCVRMFVRAFVCKFVVLSFVQCTLDLEIFSIRFTLVLNVKFLVELYYTFDFVALLPDFPHTRATTTGTNNLEYNQQHVILYW